MKHILLTGANGYIGKRLLPVLLKSHKVTCTVRDKSRFDNAHVAHPNCNVIQFDFLNPKESEHIPRDIDGAYFLIHAMSSKKGDFEELEKTIAHNFLESLKSTKVEHIVYLGGINNNNGATSKHLKSRSNVEHIFNNSDIACTTLGAGIIIGSGSSSFEIMRDLVEKLPLMVAPKWLLTNSEYIAVSNVIEYLNKVIFWKNAYNKKFDICGTKPMTYREMLLEFSKVRKLKRFIIQVPLLSPKLSSYWLYFVTATSFNLARRLVDSMKVEIIGNKNNLDKELGIETIDFNTAISLAFDKIQQSDVLSSWKDSIVSGRLKLPISNYINVPVNGCYKDVRVKKAFSVPSTIDKIWAIGGETGWYYGNWLWKLRGFVDKLFGGVGLRRGRTNIASIQVGDSLDFWRVIFSDKTEARLLLYAEMKLPGEAWLEFRVYNGKLTQTATFRPRGLAGRLYWIMVKPFHSLIFNGMASFLAH